MASPDKTTTVPKDMSSSQEECDEAEENSYIIKEKEGGSAGEGSTVVELAGAEEGETAEKTKIMGEDGDSTGDGDAMSSTAATEKNDAGNQRHGKNEVHNGNDDSSENVDVREADEFVPSSSGTEGSCGNSNGVNLGEQKAQEREEEKGPPPPSQQQKLTRPVKKARTAYFIFADEKRAEIQAAHKGEGVAAQARATGQLWSALSAEQREIYQKRAAEERDRVAKEMEALRAAGMLPQPSSSSAADGGSATGGGVGSVDNSTFFLPVARIRKISKLDPEVRGVSKEAMLLIAKSSELFLAKLGSDAVNVAQVQNRRKLLPEDVAEVCSTKEQFMFLREDVKDLMKEQVGERKKAESVKKKEDRIGLGASKPLTAYFGAAGRGTS